MLLSLEGLPDASSDDPVRRERRHAADAEFQLDRALRLNAEQPVLSGHSAAWSPDGTSIVTAFADGTVRVWDVPTGKVLTTLEGHDYVVNIAAWSPNGAHILTASRDKTARVWDVQTGKVLVTLSHAADVRWAAWSPDGARIVTVSDDRSARVWNARSGQETASLQGHGSPVEAAWSPDGARIVTASQDETARVWDATSGKVLTMLEGHRRPVLSAAWSPDGARIVTGSYDRTARVWELATGKLVARLEGHCPPTVEYGLGGCSVYSVAWRPVVSADGSLLVVSASDDKTARLWRVYGSTQALVHAAKAMPQPCPRRRRRRCPGSWPARRRTA